MRIRKRPQIPISPDPPQPTHHTAAASQPPVVALEGVGGVGVLHPNGDLPINPHGCNILRPFRPSEPLDGGDLSNTSDLHPPMPSILARTREVQQEEGQVVDAHKTWGLGGVHRVNGSGAEASQAKKNNTNMNSSNNNNNKALRPKTGDSAMGDSDGDWVMEKEERGGHGSGKKRRRRRSTPAVLMEGSRCSRVNGRGWRCCQQTLVGYSLCEHHLGKGRIRSVSSVRSNGNNAIKKKKKKKEKENDQVQHISMTLENGVEEEDEEMNLAKRRRKIGMVKARSISSLLDETNQASTMAMVDVPPPATEAAPQVVSNGAMA